MNTTLDLTPDGAGLITVTAAYTPADHVHDPESEVSKAIAERDGYALMPEWGTRPANHYLPRRITECDPSSSASPP